MNLLIVSGLSGSGKTIALQALEDIGFYCIDNLPAALLPHFVTEIKTSKTRGYDKAAAGIDARNRNFLDTVPQCLKELETMGIDFRIIFLEADESILIKRFKETRRKHPLIDKNTSLMEGIALERTLLEPMSLRASLRIDTTHTTPHDLRQQILDFVDAEETEGITLLFESFGFKHGTPLDADYVFDIRCLPNPYWQPELRRYNGKDDPVIHYMEQYEQVDKMIKDISGFIENWLPGFIQQGRSYMTIAIGCTGGQHRSVYVATKLAQYFSEKAIKTQVRHRELK